MLANALVIIGLIGAAVIGTAIAVVLFLRKNKAIETKIDNSVSTIQTAAKTVGSTITSKP